ncbi:MAG: HDIG domain-containing protein [Muribaculaceae bacterium]|nr:HDIG domain-containing protein [Muribaculaceae bacterium]
MKNSLKIKVIIFALIVLTVGVLSLFLVGGTSNKLVYIEGRPWNYPKLIAPFDIPIEYDSVRTQQIKDSINHVFSPFYTVNNDVKEKAVSNIKTAIDTISSLKQAVKSKIINDVDSMFSDGIIDIDTQNKISRGEFSQIRLYSQNDINIKIVDASQLHSHEAAYKEIKDSISMMHLPEESLLADILYQNIKPTLEYDAMKSNAQLEEEHKLALAPHGMKVKGERIIDYGEIVTPEKYTLLKTYERILDEQNVENSVKSFSRYGNILLLFLVLLSYYLFIRVLVPSVFNSMRSMVFLFCFIFLFVLIVYLISLLRPGFLYIVPFALVPIVVTIFFNTSVGFLTHMVVVLLSSFVAPDSIDFVIMQFLAGIIAVVSIKGLMQRSQLVGCAMSIFLCYTITYVTQSVVRYGAIDTIDWHVILYFAVNCIVLSFAYFIIFVVEKIFGFTSQVTLVELSDINNGVLRELSENCPGTFQHSLQVATLAGEAARQIGANVQLVRAGALYHDIGKIDNPAFFTENQSGVNPHDVLKPEQSAAIVISHVADGLKRAEKAKLPQVIKDMIAQHHGKGKTRYFYNQALRQSATGNVPAEIYTYPGPNPRTREAAILMMADACEAATKSLGHPDEQSITEMVEKIVDGQVADGMFHEAPISFKEITEVKTCLIKRLLTFYHTRVSYPEDVQPAMLLDSDAAQNENSQTEIANDQ